MTQASTSPSSLEIHTIFKGGNLDAYAVNPTTKWTMPTLNEGELGYAGNHVFLFLRPNQSISVPDFLEGLEDDPVFQLPSAPEKIEDIDLTSAKLSIIHPFGFVKSEKKHKLPKFPKDLKLKLLNTKPKTGESNLKQLYMMSVYIESTKKRIVQTEDRTVVYSANSVYRLPQVKFPPNGIVFFPGVFLTVPIKEIKIVNAESQK